MSTAATEPVIDEISESLFDPHTIKQREMHENILMALAFVNVMTMTVTFLAAPAF